MKGFYVMRRLAVHSLFFIFLFFFFFTTLLAKEAFIAGTATYTNEEVLPSNAKFEVLLEDITMIDVSSIVIGKTVLDPAGQIPIGFKITFDDEKVQLGHRYAVRAKVIYKGKLLYITDTLNAVFAGNNDKNIHLFMRRVGKVPESRVMEGMYKNTVDTALFKDCMTGKYYPVAFEGDNVALEKAYLKEINGSVISLKVEIKGKVIKRALMEGEEEKDILLVEQFIRLEGSDDCTEQHASVPITNNYWKLITLYAKEVKTESDEREAHILLREGLNGAGELKVVTGCDTLSGNYKLDENTISLQIKVPETRLENCPNALTEKDFLAALSNTVYWRIRGEKLTFFDEMDNTLATFKAIYF